MQASPEYIKLFHKNSSLIILALILSIVGFFLGDCLSLGWMAAFIIALALTKPHMGFLVLLG